MTTWTSPPPPPKHTNILSIHFQGINSRFVHAEASDWNCTFNLSNFYLFTELSIMCKLPFFPPLGNITPSSLSFLKKLLPKTPLVWCTQCIMTVSKQNLPKSDRHLKTKHVSTASAIKFGAAGWSTEFLGCLLAWYTLECLWRFILAARNRMRVECKQDCQ